MPLPPEPIKGDVADDDAAQVEQVVDQVRLGAGVALDHVDPVVLFERELTTLAQHVDPSEDRTQRRAQFVRERGEKFVFGATRDFSLLAGPALGCQQRLAAFGGDAQRLAFGCVEALDLGMHAPLLVELEPGLVLTGPGSRGRPRRADQRLDAQRPFEQHHVAEPVQRLDRSPRSLAAAAPGQHHQRKIGPGRLACHPQRQRRQFVALQHLFGEDAECRAPVQAAEKSADRFAGRRGVAGAGQHEHHHLGVATLRCEHDRTLLDRLGVARDHVRVALSSSIGVSPR